MIISQLTMLTELSFIADNMSVLKSEIGRIEKQLGKFEWILNGRDEDEDYDKEKTCQPPADEDKEQKAFFPLIDKEAVDGFYGLLESVTILITKSADEDKFIIVPSEKEIEKKILEQTKTAWFTALDLSKAYIKKTYKYHELIISFDKRDGFYEGSSLGIALTLAFLEQMLKFYNPTYIIKIKEQTAFTGGMSESGKVLACGEEIIRQKVKAVFFSEMNTFLIPKCEEAAAQAQLTELRKTYPNRKLKLISVEDIADVMNRRDVVDIRKQKLVVRTGKFVKKNWVSAVVTVLLAIFFAFLFVMDFDDNPSIVELDGQIINVKNKNGKILWFKRIALDLTKKENENAIKMLYRFDNVNNDNFKELLLCLELRKSITSNFNPGRIVCYDYQGKQLWEYLFQDSIFSKGEWQPLIYSVYLLGVLKEQNKKVLYAIASNAHFVSAVFKLNATTGERLAGTLWNAGHFQDGGIGDFNRDGQKEIVLTAISNGFERSLITSINLDKLNGNLPTSGTYKFKGIQPAKYNKLVLLPVSDYAKYLGARFNIIYRGGLRTIGDEFGIVTVEDINENSTACLNYRFDHKLNCIDVECSDELQVRRDSLVAKGILQKPYTNTLEYETKLKNEIIYK